MRVLAENIKFPEGPVYLKDGSVVLTEIDTGFLLKVTLDGKVSKFAECGPGVNGLALGPDNAFYACNNGGPLGTYKTGSIQRIDLETGAVKTLYERCGDYPLYGPNDLVFDQSGGFYFTDYGKVRPRDRDIGSLHYASIDGSMIREIVHPIANPNGICLSPDQKILYVVETETARLYAYDILEPGKVRVDPFPSPNGGRLVIGLPGYQRFDGIAVEDNGNILIATLITGVVNVISPEGKLLREVKLPEIYPTNLCFGGPDMKKLFVTLSKTGQLIEMDWPVAGHRLNYEY